MPTPASTVRKHFVSQWAGKSACGADLGGVPCPRREAHACRGATTTTENDPNGVTLGVDYLQVPILLKVQIPTDGKIFPFVYVGPYGAFELNNDFSASAFDGILTINDEADVNDFDYGAAVGAGMDFQIDNLFIGFDARYDIGMSKILEIDS